ncbi:hypothetical protein K439DRAFT_1184991 [Ramaria rubella]|nr:hypothetical protein K439DRAFT_1184991 [Ramaria rubella]
MDDKEQAIATAKQRMTNFRFRQTSPPSITTVVLHAPSAKSHARSHSRTNSITNYPLSNSSLNITHFVNEPSQDLGSLPDSPSPPSRPNSHHRRRSSVSTRRESAEMMGVVLPVETGPDNVDDQSELRCLALRKLEGKGRAENTFGGFTKVEIPDTLDVEVTSDAIQASKSKPAFSAFGLGNVLAGKRDSFGKLLISSANSLKDQLHTLMEEEEEDGEPEETIVQKMRADGLKQEVTSSQPPGHINSSCEEASYNRTVTPQLNRHRPGNLTLRPLSLTPESIPLSHMDAPPTPLLTPSPRTGLRTLTLAPSPSPSPAPSNSSTSSSASSRRQSLSVNPSFQPSDYSQRRRSVGAYPSPLSAPQRKSSISYKRTDSNGHPSSYLPTPGPTPTSPLPPLHAALPSLPNSSPGIIPDLDRPLSPTEQAFLFRSHTSLLCRISDLEQAIAGGRSKLPSGARGGFRLDELSDRPDFHERLGSITSMSEASETQSLPSHPSDEMLQLVSDLKSERDELMRDADGWRTRVADLSKQVDTLSRRVETERREGWVAQERLGLVEVEKKTIREELERGQVECQRLEEAFQIEQGTRRKTEEENDRLGIMLKEEQTKREVAEREVTRLRVELEQLRSRAEQADADLQALLITPKVQMTMQMPTPRRFNSMDSQFSSSSTTDVEEYVPVGLRSRKLNAVEEEDEDSDLPRDVTSESGSESDNDELAHYEDDEGLDDDMFGDDHTSSSFGSIVRSNSHLLRLDLAAVAPYPAPTFHVSPSHTRTGSMEKGWSFPHGAGLPSSANRDPPKVDHFFECLDALDDEPDLLPTFDSTKAKQFWRSAVKDDEGEDKMPPFVLPAQPSPPRKEKEWKEIEAAKLEVVAEEQEEEVYFKFPTLHASSKEQIVHDVFNVDPNNSATPRPASSMLTMPAYTPLKHAKAPLVPKKGNPPDPTTPTGKAHVGCTPILRHSTQISRVCFRPHIDSQTFHFSQVFPSDKDDAHDSYAHQTSYREVHAYFQHPNDVYAPSVYTSAEDDYQTSHKTAARSTPSPFEPGLTAKLSQQMHTLTSLWSPWNSSSSMASNPNDDILFKQRPMVQFVSKERQLDRLRLRLQGDVGMIEYLGHCANCRDDVIVM